MKKVIIIIGVILIIFIIAVSEKFFKNETPLNSGVFGQVFLGPICPVMRDGDDSCADKPYKTKIEAGFHRFGSDKATLSALIETDEQGKYEILLPPKSNGSYIIRAYGGNPFPRCQSQNIILENDTMLELNIKCDTGIR